MATVLLNSVIRGAWRTQESIRAWARLRYWVHRSPLTRELLGYLGPLRLEDWGRWISTCCRSHRTVGIQRSGCRLGRWRSPDRPPRSDSVLRRGAARPQGRSQRRSRPGSQDRDQRGPPRAEGPCGTTPVPVPPAWRPCPPRLRAGCAHRRPLRRWLSTASLVVECPSSALHRHLGS
jgi:hypothetical protein